MSIKIIILKFRETRNPCARGYIYIYSFENIN